MLLACIAVVFGLIVLVWSSDKFVDGSAAIAQNFGMTKLMVGLTIVALGTSAPEILVSVMASLNGSSGLAIGNALGSNIANIGLVLGLTACFVIIPVHKLSARQDVPVYLLLSALVAWVLHDSLITWLDSALLLLSLLVIITLVVLFRRKVKDPVLLKELVEENPEQALTNRQALITFFVGLVFLLLSARLLVWGAVGIAERLGVSELIIGLTIVAIGTSLPELAATLGSALKKHHDLAIGNIVGSNILNLAAVLAMPGLIARTEVDPLVFQRDFMVMTLLSILMALFIWLPSTFPQLTRLKGATLLLVYFAYIIFLIQDSL